MLTTISTVSHANIFVNPFLSSSGAYYASEGQRLLGLEGEAEDTAAATLAGTASMNISDYVTHVMQRLWEEGVRCDTVIGQDVKGSILRVVEETLVGAHVDTIVQRGLPLMFEHNGIFELHLMYDLLERVSGLPTLRKFYGEHLKVCCSADL
jgi:cullin-4